MWELTFKMATRRHCTFCTGIYFSTEAEAHLSQSLRHSVTALVAQACLSTQPSNLIKAQSCSCFVEIVLRGILCPQFHRTVHLSNLQCLILKSVTNEYSSSINYLVALLGGVSYTVNLYFSTWVSKSLLWDLEKKKRSGITTPNKRLSGPQCEKSDLKVVARWDFPFVGERVVINLLHKTASLQWNLALLLTSCGILSKLFISFFICKMGTVVPCMIVSRIKCDLHINCLEHCRRLINGCDDSKITMILIAVILLINNLVLKDDIAKVIQDMVASKHP